MRRRLLWFVPLAAALVLAGACRSPVRGGLERRTLETGEPPPTAEAVAGLPNFGVVDDGLFRSAQPTAVGFAEARRLKVKTVVNLRSSHSDEDLVRGTGLARVSIPMHPWKASDEEVADFLKVATDPESRPVLVHCAQGQDRTGVVVAAYRRVVQGWSADDAVREMESYGNSPLWWNLRAYVRGLDVDRMKALVASRAKPAVSRGE